MSLELARAEGKPMEIDPRPDFPLLDGAADELVYLDSAATTQKPRAVIEAVTGYYEASCSNVHRGLYGLAERATEAYEGARDRVARFLNAPHRSGVVFTRSCTEAINLVARSWAEERLGPDDEILLSVQEHHSNLLPWQQAARRTGARLRYLPLTDDGDLDLRQLEQLVSARTRLVAVTGLSNVLGTLTPLEPIVAAARGVGAKILVDGAQLVLHRPVDMQALDLDFFAMSGHKALGPTGVGVLAARPELLEAMEPFMTGGEMVLDASLDGPPRYNAIPHKFEAGTPPIAQVIGLGAALAYLEALGHDWIRAHDRRLYLHGRRVLQAVEGLTLHGAGGDPEARVATFAFSLRDLHPHDVGTFLAHEGIAVRAGHHCARPLHRLLGQPATCRASASIYNTEAELDRLATALSRARAYFR